MNKINAVIFDLDGTLLDTLEDLAESCNKALSEFGMPNHSIDDVRRFVGNGLGVLMELAVPGGRSNPQFDAALKRMKEIYAENDKNKTRPYGGVIELIAALNARGIKTGIVSNKPDAQVKELAELYFSGHIDSKCAAGENESAGIKRKPAPDSVFEVMKQLGAEPGHTVYVGDSDVDLATAKNAGIPCISVCWGFRSEEFLREHGATVLVHSPEQVLNLVFPASEA